MNVYLLNHRRMIKRHIFDTKKIGYFDSEAAAEEAKKQLLSKVGFRDYPDAFQCYIMRIPDTEDQILSVFEVGHERDLKNDDTYFTFLGVYGKESSAQNRIRKCKKWKKFRNYSEGFYYEKYELNKAEWQEGFNSFDDN